MEHYDKKKKKRKKEVSVVKLIDFSGEPKADHIPTLRGSKGKKISGIAEKINDAIRFLVDERPGGGSKFTTGEAAPSQTTEELTRQMQAQPQSPV